MLPSILVAAPTSITKDYAFLEWISHVNNIDYPKYKLDVMLVDNSRERGYDKYLQSFGVIVRHVNPRNRSAIEFICESHNAIRDYFIYNQYDYLLHLESDVMIQTQTLRTLLFHSQQNNWPVVSASYFFGNDEHTTMLLQRLELHGKVYTAQNIGFKEGLSMCGGVLGTYASGLGAVLIRRDVLENIKFRFDRKDHCYPDSFFHDDVFKKGIANYTDTSIILDHRSQSWNLNMDSYIAINPKTK